MQGKCFATGSDFLFFGVVIMEKVGVYTSLREGGGLGRSPKTEGASGRKANLIAGDSTSQSHPFSYTDWRKRLVNWHSVSAVMSTYHPISKLSANSPLAPSVTAMP